MLKTQYKGYLGAGPLQLELIIAFQRWEEGKAVGERVVAWVAVFGSFAVVFRRGEAMRVTRSAGIGR
jgi:hypothetical protein